jgi:hypothetical protein
MNSTCGHQFNPLALERLKIIILCDQRSPDFSAFRLPFTRASTDPLVQSSESSRLNGIDLIALIKMPDRTAIERDRH